MRFDGAAQLIGSSHVITELQDEINRVARTDAKILITGESGTGKEVVARQVWLSSRRANRAFVAVNCAGMPETLLESELFGHERGSFTGAYRDKPGKLEIADDGTIFLDEVGEMTLRMQSLLLRFLETGEIQKVGSHQSGTRVNVRTIAATNRDLAEMIRQGQFREDLFYRLNVIHLIAPPLRERKEDIPALINHFLGRLGQTGSPVRTMSPEALALLVDYQWAGNVRELQNVLERILVRARHDVIGVEDIPHEIRASRQPGVAPFRERRRSIADDLYQRMTAEQQSFWTTVYPLFMQREITRNSVRDVVRRGLQDARGNYKIVARMFNMEHDYKKFLNFLRKHHCQPSFKEFR